MEQELLLKRIRNNAPTAPKCPLCGESKFVIRTGHESVDHELAVLIALICQNCGLMLYMDPG